MQKNDLFKIKQNNSFKYSFVIAAHLWVQEKSSVFYLLQFNYLCILTHECVGITHMCVKIFFEHDHVFGMNLGI